MAIIGEHEQLRQREINGRLSRDSQHHAIAAILALGPVRHDGVVRNLSPRAAMFEGTSDVEAGDRVILDIQGVGNIGATVVWRLGLRSGVVFDPSIDVS